MRLSQTMRTLFFFIFLGLVAACASNPIPNVSQAEADSINDLLASARLEREVRNDAFYGFRLMDILSPSRWTQLGFANGDVVTAVDDRELKEFDGALKLVAALADAKPNKYRVERRKPPKTFEIQESAPKKKI